MDNLQAKIEQLERELAEVKDKLQLAEETLQAIHSGAVDAVVITTDQGMQIFTLQGADYVYQQFIEEMGEGAATVSNDGLILYGNKRLSQLLNCPLKNLIGLPLENFIQDKDRKKFHSLLNQVKLEEALTIELSLIALNTNQEIPIKLSFKKFNVDDIIINMILFTDITEEKIREAAKINQILTSANAAIATYKLFPDQTWEFESWLSGCEKILGYTAEELLADQGLWLRSVHPQDISAIIPQLLEDNQLTQVSNKEYRFFHKDGSLRWINSSQFFEWDHINHYWIGTDILIDITERKQAEIALKEQMTRELVVTNIAQEIRKTLEFHQILQTTVNQVREFLHTDRVIILRFQPDWTVTVLTESVNPDYPAIVGVEIHDPCFRGKYIEAYSQGVVTSKTDIYDSEQPCYLEMMEQFQVRANLAVPILQGDQLWGLLIVHQCSQPRQWFPSEIDLIKQLTLQLSIAIHQSELYQQTRQELLERQKAQEALFKSEEHLKAILEYAPAVIYLIDLENQHLLVNQRYAELLFRTSQELLGKSIYEVWPKNIADKFAANNLTIIQNQQILQVEEIVPQSDGFHTYISLKFPLCDRDGKVYAVGGISTDITERKQAQRKIAEQAALIDIATDAIFVQDLENRILFWSKGAERLYGWTQAEVLGEKSHNLFNQGLERTEAFETIMQRGAWQGELEQITKTGQKIIVESHRTLVENEFSQRKSILVVNSNITEKKEIEKQFYHAQRLESLGTLASGIAHDFNNILTPILGISQLLPLKFSNLDESTERLLTVLANSARRGVDLVKQILLFSRNTDSNSSTLQIGYLILELIGIVKQTFPRSITISAEISTKDIWTVSGDPTQMQQVFMNLMVNARDAMPEGGILTVSAENCQLDQHYAAMNLEATPGSYVRVTISDTGTGISPDLFDRIFDPFFTTKKTGQGTGLGLSTVRGIIKNHGGFVKVYSELGRGTKFEIFLPAIQETETNPIPVEEIMPKGNGELILIVDDERPVQEITKTALENYNYQTLTASDGQEALSIYAQNQRGIKVILMDLMMPNLDGISAIRTLKKINPLVKIIATSGLSSNQKVALEANANQFLLKPYTMSQLLQSLREVMGGQSENLDYIAGKNNFSDPECLKAALAQMPRNWLQQMYEAAYAVDADVMLELIAEISESHQILAETLKDLVMNFDTDLILEWIAALLTSSDSDQNPHP